MIPKSRSAADSTTPDASAADARDGDGESSEEAVHPGGTAGPSAPDAGTSETSQLRGDVQRGLGWSFIGTFSLRAGSFLTNIALARLIAPEEFGLFAVAIAVNTILVNMNDLGLIYGLVRWQGDTTKVVPTAVTLAGAASIVLYAITFVSAPALASALGSPGSGDLLRLLSVVVLIDAVSAGPAAMLIRDFRQKVRAFAQIAGMVTYASIAITMASQGAGAWSLAWGQVAGNALTTIIMVLVVRPPKPGFELKVARSLLAFGLPMSGAGLVAQALLNVDYVVIAGALSSAELGFYLLAFNMSSWPVQVASTAIRPISIAGFSKMRGDPAALERARRSSLTSLVKVAVPAVVLLVALADPLVEFVYGPRWAPAAEALRFLALMGGLRVVTGLMGDMVLAEGRSRTILLVRLTWLAALVPVLMAGARLDGIRGVGMGHALVALVVVLPAHIVALRRIGMRLGHVGVRVMRPLLAGVLAGAAAIVASGPIGTPVLELLAGTTTALAVYAGLAVTREDLAAVRRWRTRRRTRSGAADQ